MTRKYYFIIETLLGLAALFAVDFFFMRNSVAFLDVRPHPYWFVVLLIAARYGTVAGLFAGSCAAVAFILFASSASPEFAQFSFPHGPYTLPFFFILVGGGLGEIRNWQKKIHDKVKLRLEEKTETLERLSVQHEALIESKQELDKRVAFQSTTMVSLFEKLTDLEKLPPKKLFRSIPALLAGQLNVRRASIYLVHNNKLKLAARNGANKGRIPDTVELDSGMMGEVVRTKSVVTINHMLSDDPQRFEQVGIVMAAPILRRDDSLVGIINIERIPFFDYNGNTVRIFEMLAYWVSIVADQAMQFQQLKDKNIADEITGAYNYLYFQKRLQYEIARTKRFHSPLSLMLLRIKHFDQLTQAERSNVLTVLHWIFDNILREVDIIAKYREDSTFAILLPGQGSSDSETIMERLRTEVNNYGLRPFENHDDPLEIEFGLSNLQPKEGSYESLVRSAEERLEAGGEREPAQIFDDISYILKSGRDGGGEEAEAE